MTGDGIIGRSSDYLKRGDTKALMRLSREERALFTKCAVSEVH